MPDIHDPAVMPRLDPASLGLSELIGVMRSGSGAAQDEAWAECYRRYRQLVWSRVYYVVRTIPKIAEARELAEDVTSDVFVGLPEAVQHYHEDGRAEQWLKRVAVRMALRRKESLTGSWSSGRKSHGGAAEAPARASGPVRRVQVSFDELADQIVEELDAVQAEEVLELERRLDAMRTSPDELHHRWADFVDLYRAGFDYDEISRRLGITEGTARNWLCRIRKHLAQAPEARTHA